MKRIQDFNGKILKARFHFQANGLKLFHQPICSQCTLSLPSENIRKPQGFSDVFRGQTKGALGTNSLVKFKVYVRKWVQVSFDNARNSYLIYNILFRATFFEYVKYFYWLP